MDGKEEKRPESTQQPKKSWPDIIDSYRIWPRAFITIYLVLLYDVVYWFLDLTEPNNAQAGLVSVLVGAGAAWFSAYVNSGKKTE